MANAEKTQGQLLQEKLASNPKHAEIFLNNDELDASTAFNEDYKAFMNVAKTERESVKTAIGMLKEKGFVEFVPGTKYTAGDKIYLNNRGKALLFATIGKKPIEEGTHIVASHIDTPRIDLKPNPLYEELGFAMMKTHYYGGIKKYQWVTIPLSMHGVIVKKDGTKVDVLIGEDDADPVFYITDILPHLGAEQAKRTLSEGIKGEELNLVVGTIPYKDENVSEKVKLNVLSILNDKYDITEDDLYSADLSLVPATKARDVGFDRSMVAAYGHDDRVCAYTSLRASMDVTNPEYTWINVLADREEIGSDGNTGLNSRMLEYFIADIAEPYGVAAHTVLSKSKCLSADVNVAMDPTFSDITDNYNVAKFGYGVGLCKYTGSRGKSGTSEAHAEFLGHLRGVFDNAGVQWQNASMGKVDMGGGGTVAMFVANLGVEVVDIGVPVLAMHAPMELVSKTDVYAAYRAFVAFMESK